MFYVEERLLWCNGEHTGKGKTRSRNVLGSIRLVKVRDEAG
jgi:hypothetical protein